MGKLSVGNEPRYLIVNADDLGMSAGVNQGIFQSHQNGIVTAASLLVRWPAAAAAVEQAQDMPGLCLGLHVDLGEWAYRHGQWVTLYEVVPTHDEERVAEELERQLNAFRDLTGRNPTHLDSHQHVHREEPLLSLLTGVASKLGIPLRSFTSSIQYCGDFYGQSKLGESLPKNLTPQALIDVLQRLPGGITELACHPGLDRELDTMYCQERFWEVETLCDPSVRSAIESFGIELCTFEQLAGVTR